MLPTASGGVILKAGWLVEADKAIVSRFDFSRTGQLEVLSVHCMHSRMCSLDPQPFCRNHYVMQVVGSRVFECIVLCPGTCHQCLFPVLFCVLLNLTGCDNIHRDKDKRASLVTCGCVNDGSLGLSMQQESSGHLRTLLLLALVQGHLHTLYIIYIIQGACWMLP